MLLAYELREVVDGLGPESDESEELLGVVQVGMMLDQEKQPLLKRVQPELLARVRERLDAPETARYGDAAIAAKGLFLAPEAG